MLSTLVVLVIGVKEAWDGLATVADTGTLLSAALIVILIVASVVRFTGDRSAPWRDRTVHALAVIAVALVVLMLVATFRAHTSSDRFADRMDDFPLPRDYESASTTGVDARSQGDPEHVVRAWKVPAGADACAAMTRAVGTTGSSRTVCSRAPLPHRVSSTGSPSSRSTGSRLDPVASWTRCSRSTRT